MKDLDFDELDKAVNSLMTEVPRSDEVPTGEEEKTLDITPTLGVNDTPSFDTLSASTAEAAQVAAISPVARKEAVTDAPITRRAGRFMDVVHPSSDMKNSANLAHQISRQGATIEPRGANQPDVPRPVAPSTSTQPALQQSSPRPPVAADTPADTWPDPLEIANFKDSALAKEEGNKVISVESDASTQPPDQTPLTSPFLPDTKVEKRPLGSAIPPAGEEPNPVLSADTDVHNDTTNGDPNAQLPASPSDTPPQLPEELQQDMIAVEADTHMGVPKTEQTPPADEKLLASGTVPGVIPSVASPVTSAGPISIPQQYREEPSTGDQENGGIYDTDSYHKPLVRPTKKKSGWLWVVWIVVILLVGAGAGVAMYLFVI